MKVNAVVLWCSTNLKVRGSDPFLVNCVRCHRYNGRGQSLMSRRWRKPSERCASATKPSGALSLRHEMTAAPTLRKRPFDQTHFGFLQIIRELSGIASPEFCPDVEVSLHIEQFVRQMIFREVFFDEIAVFILHLQHSLLMPKWRSGNILKKKPR